MGGLFEIQWNLSDIDQCRADRCDLNKCFCTKPAFEAHKGTISV